MKLLVRFVFCGFLIAISLQPQAQQLWSENVSNGQEFVRRVALVKPTAGFKLMNLNMAKLKQLQSAIPLIRMDNQVQGISIEMPMPDGTIQSTNIVETIIWEKKSVADRVGIKTYSLINPTTKKFEGNISVIDNGISGIFFSDKGTVLIQPITIGSNSMTTNMVYYVSDAEMPPLDCPVVDEHNTLKETSLNKTTAGDCKSRVYRLAVAATGEYVVWAGGTVAQAKAYITATTNIVNAIYKRDLNVTFTLVDNTAVIFTDATTDPYTSGAASSTMLNENQTVLDNAPSIGSSGYDVGLVFSGASSGGIAQLNSVCNNSGKGRGAIGKGSNSPTPINNWFSTAVAHELGHMFGATHTFSSTLSPCNSNISAASSWEPGNGTTIMSYAVGCPVGTRVQDSTDFYFHSGSIAQMQNYIASGATCTTPITTENVAPIASVTATSYNVPANTPFMLTMSASDANSNALTYSWEQMDASTTSQTGPPPSSNTTGPLFRSLLPSTSATRYLPSLTYLTSATSYAYEVLPTVERTLNFRGTVRDNSLLGGCTAEVNVALNVKSSTGFYVNLPGWGSVWTKNGNNTAQVQWEVGGTNSAPINCTQVDILLSTDGGFTYPITLASGVANSGSFNVPIPSLNTLTARVMVKGTNNVFFNISTDNFKIADALPVTFLSFSAKKSGNNALVEWSTATEANSDKFIVERSADGKDFTTQVGSIKAAGTSNQVKAYSLNDIAPLSKWNYYRLKQLDLDGKSTYSAIASVYFNRDNNTFVSVYPNPVKGNATINFYSKNGGNVAMEVYDSKGAVVKKMNKAATIEMNTASLDLQALPTGVYTLKCFSSTELIGVTKLVKE